MKGIYKIICLIDDKVYIGSTSVSFKGRFKKHNKYPKFLKKCVFHEISIFIHNKTHFCLQTVSNCRRGVD